MHQTFDTTSRPNHIRATKINDFEVHIGTVGHNDLYSAVMNVLRMCQSPDKMTRDSDPVTITCDMSLELQYVTITGMALFFFSEL